MCFQPGLTPASGARLLGDVLARRSRQLSYGGGSTTLLVCGYLACDAKLAGMLLAGFLGLVSFNVRVPNAGSWLEVSLCCALAEARSPPPGGAGVMARLLFIEVLRPYMNEQAEGLTGWLAGVGDQIVGSAPNATHRSPARAWKLDDLARTTGSSWSVRARRFQNLMGSSCIQQLTQWRMLLASNLLRARDVPLARIAEEVVYQTDTAFSPLRKDQLARESLY